MYVAPVTLTSTLSDGFTLRDVLFTVKDTLSTIRIRAVPVIPFASPVISTFFALLPAVNKPEELMLPLSFDREYVTADPLEATGINILSVICVDS